MGGDGVSSTPTSSDQKKKKSRERSNALPYTLV